MTTNCNDTACQARHELFRTDHRLFRELPFVGLQHFEADSMGPADTLELRNCVFCKSTLAWSWAGIAYEAGK